MTSHHLTDATKKIHTTIMSSSDHALITLEVDLESTTQRGPGFWRFPPELLSDQSFVSGMIKFLQDWEPPPELSSPNSIWEWLKQEIKTWTRHYMKTHRNEQIRMLEELEKELVTLTKRRDKENPILISQ